MAKNNILKRFLAIGIMAWMLLTLVPGIGVSAAVSLPNGGFEKEGDWYKDQGEFGKEYTYDSDAHSGSAALRIKGLKSLYVRCAAMAVSPGAEITFKGYYKVNSLPGSSSYPAIKIEFFDANKNALPEEVNYWGEYKNPEKGKWVEVTETVTAPENAGHLRILVRLMNGGDILWDDLSLRENGGTAAEEVTLQSFTFSDPLPGETNKITENAGFEDDLNSWAEGGSGERSVVEDAERGKVLKLVSTDGSKPWVMKEIPVKEGETYQATAYLKTETVSGDGPAFKVEYYSNRGGEAAVSGAQDVFCPYFEPTNGAWKKVGTTFTVGDNTDVAKLYVRLYGNGVVYYDDVECVKIAEPAYKLQLDTHVFYYTEWDEGKAYVRVNYPSDGTVNFTLYDGETVLDSKTVTADFETVYRFPIHLLAEKGKGYKITAVHKDASGEVIGSGEDTIYRYDRPTHLTEDGLFKLHDGTLLKPVLGYHNYQSDFEEIKAAGVNILQSDHSDPNKATMLNIPHLLEYMDDAWYNHGMLTAVVMYPGMSYVIHEDRREQAIACINAVKDHPGLFGYMVMDEPFVRHENDADGGLKVYEMLKESYKLIRDNDPDHPTYLCENYGYRYDWSSDCVDVLGIDPYPYRKNIGKLVYDAGMSAAAASEYKKPVYNILQAWPWEGYEPNSTELRNMAYQAMFAGNEGLAMYDLSDFYGVDGVYTNLWDRELSKGATDFFENEYEDAYKAFITGEYPIFCESYGYEVTDNWYRIFAKDGELYVVVLNINSSPGTVEIPLTSADGSIQIGAFTATEADNSGLLPTITGNGTLQVTLTMSCQAARYKVTPAEPVDFSGLTATRFRDVAEYDWAKEAICALDAKGIANTKALWRYAPGENITRADFAYFLIQTLGLTSDSTANFADVNPDAYYAKALATGKALGILKGVGENEFNPYAEISRQDLMTICARGLNLANGSADTETLQKFSDSEYVADYAAVSVAAMVRSALVNGYEDGTVRPLGNTTRAETAVIMHRIMKMQNDL